MFERLKQSRTWIKWPVALLLLTYLYYTNRQDLAHLVTEPKNWSYLVLASVLAAGAMLLTFYRWYLLVSAQDFPFTVRDAVRLGYIGYLFGYVAPGAAGGDLFKAGMIAMEQTSRKGIAMATVLLDRIMGVLALFMVGALAMFFQDPQIFQNAAVRFCVALLWTGTIGGTIGFIVLLHPAVPRSRFLRRLIRLRVVGNLIAGLVNAVLLYQQRHLVLVLTVLISIVAHFGTLSSFYYCGLAINAGNAAPGYWTQFLLIPIAELLAFLVPVPGGVGILEGGVAKAYVWSNQAPGVASVTIQQASAAGFAAALANRVINIVIVAIGAAFYLTASGEFRRGLEPPPGPPLA